MTNEELEAYFRKRRKNKKIISVIVIVFVLITGGTLAFWYFFTYDRIISLFVPVDEKNVILVECFWNENTEDKYMMIKRLHLDEDVLWESRREGSMGTWQDPAYHLYLHKNSVTNDTFTFAFDPDQEKDEKELRMVQYDYNTGKINWERGIPFAEQIDYTSISDGKRIYLFYLHYAGDILLALELESGETVWETDASDMYLLNDFHPLLTEEYLILIRDTETVLIKKDTGEKKRIDNYNFGAVIDNELIYTVDNEGMTGVWRSSLKDFSRELILTGEDIVKVAVYLDSIVLFYKHGIKRLSLKDGNLYWDFRFGDEFFFDIYNSTLMPPQNKVFNSITTRYLPVVLRADNNFFYTKAKFLILDLDEGHIVQQSKANYLNTDYLSNNSMFFYDGCYYISIFIPYEVFFDKTCILVLNGNTGELTNAFQFFYGNESTYFYLVHYIYGSLYSYQLKNNCLFIEDEDRLIVFNLDTGQYIYGEPDSLVFRGYQKEIKEHYGLSFLN